MGTLFLITPRKEKKYIEAKLLPPFKKKKKKLETSLSIFPISER
jgi:hypothetical protein